MNVRLATFDHAVTALIAACCSGVANGAKPFQGSPLPVFSPYARVDQVLIASGKLKVKSAAVPKAPFHFVPNKSESM